MRLRVAIHGESDVGIARIRTHGFALDEGFDEVAAAAIHADSGELALGVVRELGRHGIVAVVRDAGPGIADLELAMQDGYSTTTGLGLGLPSARRLVDTLHIRSEPSVGTTVTATMWHPPGAGSWRAGVRRGLAA